MLYFTDKRVTSVQVHMLINKFTKFHHSSNYAFWVTRDTHKKKKLMDGRTDGWTRVNLYAPTHSPSESGGIKIQYACS